MKLTKNDYETIVEIAKRSETLNIGFGDRITRLMDIEFACNQFNIDLFKFLTCQDFDFAHDFVGIQMRLDRLNNKWNDDCFVPRCAR
jgi:hypothetical protein